MSIDNGIVSTSLTWTPALPHISSGISLNFTIFAHRTRPNLGVVRLEVSGLPSASVVTLTDVLDGAGSWRTTAVGSGLLPNSTASTIYSAVQPNGITNVTAYEISTLDFVSPSTGKPTTSTGCFSGVSQNASTASQCYAVQPSKGSFSVVKYVGIASSDAFKGTELRTALGATTHAISQGYDAILAEHTQAWEALWEESDIIIPGESIEIQELQLATRASLFHLLSNVRQGSEGTGLGDNSIAPAGLTSDSYAGQIFWDAVGIIYGPFRLPITG
jgi:trehalose/maltose hydrolase-like predicted phosphorylase